MRTRRLRLAGLVAALGTVAAACASSPPEAVLRGVPLSATSTTASTTTSTTEATTTTSSSTTTTVASSTTVPPPPPPGLGVGARGPEVASLEQALDAQRYDVGTVDDVFDKVTMYAVMAFQKVNGMARSGRATQDVVDAVMSVPPTPAALVPGGNATRVEVDIVRQVLFLYEGGALFRILPISSGSGSRFCSEGYCRYAHTPSGAFGVYRTARGWEKGPLGSLYNPLYFNGGIAIHGSLSVPATPASHGCIRIPMNAAEWFPTRVGLGTAVYVLGGTGDGAIPPAVLEAPPTTTTTLPPVTVPPLLGGLFAPPTTAKQPGTVTSGD